MGGVLGASRDNKGEWIATGEFDLRLENIRNRGNSLDLVWRQPDERSRFINFSYEKVIADANILKPAYLVFKNYELILKWNRSLRFALAVCTLKDKFTDEL